MIIVAHQNATFVRGCPTNENEFPIASLEEIALIDSQIAESFEARAKTSAGHKDEALLLKASEVFRQRAKDEGHIKKAADSRELAAYLATGDITAVAALNLLAQHAPLPRIAALYRNLAMTFVQREEFDNPIGLGPMKFLPPSPDRIIKEDYFLK